MGWLSWAWPSDKRDRTDPKQDAARKLSPATNIAGAGGELAGGSPDNETEKALKRASGEDRSSSD